MNWSDNDSVGRTAAQAFSSPTILASRRFASRLSRSRTPNGSRRSTSVIRSKEDAKIFDQMTISTSVSFNKSDTVSQQRQRHSNNRPSPRLVSSNSAVPSVNELNRCDSQIEEVVRGVNETAHRLVSQLQVSASESLLSLSGPVPQLEAREIEQEDRLDARQHWSSFRDEEDTNIEETEENSSLELIYNDKAFQWLANVVVEFFEKRLDLHRAMIVLQPEDRALLEQILPKQYHRSFIHAVRIRLDSTSRHIRHAEATPLDSVILQCSELGFTCQGRSNPILATLSLGVDPALVPLGTNDTFKTPRANKKKSVGLNTTPLHSEKEAKSNNIPDKKKAVVSTQNDTKKSVNSNPTPLKSNSVPDSDRAMVSTERDKKKTVSFDPKPLHTEKETRSNIGVRYNIRAMVSKDKEKESVSGKFHSALNEKVEEDDTENGKRSTNDRGQPLHPSVSNTSHGDKVVTINTELNNHESVEVVIPGEHSTKKQATIDGKILEASSSDSSGIICHKEKGMPTDRSASVTNTQEPSNSLHRSRKAESQTLSEQLLMFKRRFMLLKVMNSKDTSSMDHPTQVKEDVDIKNMSRQQLLTASREATRLVEESETPEVAMFWVDQVTYLQSRLRTITGQVGNKLERDSNISDSNCTPTTETVQRKQQKSKSQTSPSASTAHDNCNEIQSKSMPKSSLSKKSIPDKPLPKKSMPESVVLSEKDAHSQSHSHGDVHVHPVDDIIALRSYSSQGSEKSENVSKTPKDDHTSITDDSSWARRLIPLLNLFQGDKTISNHVPKSQQYTDYADQGADYFQCSDNVQTTNAQQDGGSATADGGTSQPYCVLPLVDVLAPADLPGGYHFEADIEGKRFLATVPMGGVKEGETFTCYMRELDSEYIDIPVGNWKDNLSSLCEFGCCHPVIWNSLFCPLLMLSQIQYRVEFDFLGRPVVKDEKSIQAHHLTNRAMMLIVTGAWLMINTCIYMGYNWKWSRGLDLTFADISAIVLVNVTMYSFIIFITQNSRNSLREMFLIREQRCHDLEDIILAMTCLPCTVGQMSRHTANYNDYEAVCCSKTGLPDGVRMNQSQNDANDGYV